MHRSPRFTQFVMAAALAVVFAQPAAAQSDESNRVEFELTPYLWTLALDGEMIVDGQAFPIDASISDVAQASDYGISARLEFNLARWTLLFDVLYMDASEDSGTIHLQYDKLALVGTLGYRVTSQIDVMAGGRVHNLSYELTDSENELAESSRGWFDPLLGGRIRWPISSRWQLRAAGHLGGLGIGSDLAWGLEGSIYYNVLSNLSVGLGYRFWDIDYSTGSADELFAYDVTHSGPGIGVIFRSY